MSASTSFRVRPMVNDRARPTLNQAIAGALSGFASTVILQPCQLLFIYSNHPRIKPYLTT